MSELSLFILSLLWFTFPCFLSSDLCAVYILVNKGINAFLSGLVSSPIERGGGEYIIKFVTQTYRVICDIKGHRENCTTHFNLFRYKTLRQGTGTPGLKVTCTC